MKGFLSELGQKSVKCPVNQAATLIMVDNKATVDLMHEPRNQEKSRHWFLAYSWAQELQSLGIVRYRHINGVENLSDMLTKPITVKTYKSLSKQHENEEYNRNLMKTHYELYEAEFDQTLQEPVYAS